MMYRGRNPNDSTAASFDARGVAWFALLGLASLIVPVNVSSAEKTPAPFLAPAKPASAAEDLKVESRILRALKDKQLRSSGLYVTVTNGTARISGSVPSLEEKKRILAIAEEITGVLKVESGDLHIAKTPQRPKPLSLPLEDDKPTRTRSASPNALFGTPDALAARHPLPPTQSTPNPSGPQRITLMAPEAVTVPSRMPETTRLTANPRTPPPASSLPAALDRLRQRDARFRTIRTEVRGTTVRIFPGDDATDEQVMTFVQAIRRLPGVQRVIIQDTSARPH